MQVPNNEWYLYIEPANGWAPEFPWPALVLALVVVASLVLSCLLFTLLVSVMRRRALLLTMMPAKALHEVGRGRVGFNNNAPAS